MRAPQLNWGCLPHSVSENTAGARVLRTASVQELTPHVDGGIEGGGAGPGERSSRRRSAVLAGLRTAEACKHSHDTERKPPRRAYATGAREPH